MSLRDQLLKAGLVSKKQAQKTEAANRKQAHDTKKNKELADKVNAEKLDELKKIEDEKNQRRELDKELNKQRDLLMSQRESYYRSLQILNSNSLNTRSANEYYFFAEGNRIKKIMVNSWQREMLARGKMGIGKPHKEIDEYVIIPLNAARVINEIFPQKLITLHSEIEDSEELDDGF
ncbi:DUF2058 family protein [Fluviispira sanaruensis]|uniref:DUF2058 domain-containing protein n=1 Tax=Fluviispira sanaruensis TaxID=2493639 RepID=A0A4V0P293_FLUSA|nr:DUF2058 family protein [Fluviispira sanaruensis]BBH52427.1 DUF2058 domain-containing protein [Fluviispira sanaruensis]